MKKIIELDVNGLDVSLYRLQEKLVPIRVTETGELFIYTVLAEDPDSFMPKKPLRFTRVIFDNYEELAKIEQVIWTLTRHCEPADYWLIMDLPLPGAKHWLQQGVLTSGALATNQYDGMDSEILLKLFQGQTIPLDPVSSGCNHARAFRFMALSPSSYDNSVLEHAYNHIPEHKRAFRDLVWNTDFVLSDSILEVFPYGEEDCDHVGIKLTSTLNREIVRQEVQEIYQLPYQIITLSDQEFIEWQDNGRIDLLQYNH